MSAKIKVMSFNLRVVAASDGINNFYNRKGRILETINNESPDLIGFQEANNEMRDWLIEELTPKYLVIGCGRDAKYRGESTIVAYKVSKFMMISAETFWLSATPHVPGTRYPGDQSSCPRVCTAVCLKHNDADTLLWFYNTHTDHRGKTARLLAAEQIMVHISETVGNGKFVLTGDMNACPDAPEILAFTTSLSDRNVVDATSRLAGTFHAFGKYSKEEAQKIDYVFTDAETDPTESYKIDDNAVDGVYISDHNPVCAFIKIE